jgi:serpin B
MSLAGAKGETAEEMKRALRLSLSDERLHPAFGSLLWELYGQGQPRGYTLRLANALWADESIKLAQPFLDTLRDNYSISGQTVDFRDREKAAQIINDWGKEQTAERIEKVISPEEINKDDLFVLASAVAFQGVWASKFDPRHTQERDFHVSKKRTVKVPMMRQEGEFKFYPFVGEEESIKSVRILCLPFRGKEMEFIALLPAEPDGLAELETSLTPKQLDEWLSFPPWGRKVRVAFPRFTLRTRQSLIDPLRGLDMKRAFEPGKSDFSGISQTHPMFLNWVMQQTTVTVDEEGSTATTVAVPKGAKGGPPPGWVNFSADRPFLFLIRHARTGTILFIGRVVDPTA